MNAGARCGLVDASGLGNVVGRVVGHGLGNVVGRVVGHGLGNVVERVAGHAIETCTSSRNGHGNMVGRGFRNRRAIANAFATSSNTHVNQDASPALQAARQHHVKRCANSVTHDTRSH